mmetsp:Transcript_31674/g.99329  ORF Transcript_31674/g.99329 Transcript_31674/m.99329 type:complete len:253 (-) Transcript_31674:8-766(-)
MALADPEGRGEVLQVDGRRGFRRWRQADGPTVLSEDEAAEAFRHTATSQALGRAEVARDARCLPAYVELPPALKPLLCLPPLPLEPILPVVPEQQLRHALAVGEAVRLVPRVLVDHLSNGEAALLAQEQLLRFPCQLGICGAADELRTAELLLQRRASLFLVLVLALRIGVGVLPHKGLAPVAQRSRPGSIRLLEALVVHPQGSSSWSGHGVLCRRRHGLVGPRGVRLHSGLRGILHWRPPARSAPAQGLAP